MSSPKACWALVGALLGASPGCLETSPATSTPGAVGSQQDDSSSLPVFPGAEGFGTRTRAGRGGRTVAVTSLADAGPGTLRAALDDPSPKTVVFRVGGVIELRSHLFVNHPFVTIAGQTAPGDGVVLKDFGLVITTNDVLIQHLRVRPGNRGRVRPDHNDAVAVLGRHGEVSGARNVVLDHVSLSWAEDEVASTWFGAHDVTISWSIISEGLNRSRHPKRTHSAGLLVGDGSDRVSVHHSLFAHNDFRNPAIVSGGTHEFRDNVVYNWGVLATEVVADGPNLVVDVEGNSYQTGPSTRAPREILIQRPRHGFPRLFVRGNRGPSRETGGTDWGMVYLGERAAPTQYRSATRAVPSVRDARVATPDTTLTEEAVLAGAGATLPRRDAVDARIVTEVRRRSGAIIDSPDQAGGYPSYRGGFPPPDADADGMPDDWERAAGLDPEDPADALHDRDGDGYTSLEDYLFSLTRDAHLGPVAARP
jgi:pectate lyase